MGDPLAEARNDGEVILYAELDFDEITRARFDLDVVGHSARPDIFDLRVDERELIGSHWIRPPRTRVIHRLWNSTKTLT